MPIPTTCLGAFPKPDYVPVRDWFQTGHDNDSFGDRVTRDWARHQSDDTTALLDRATAQVIADQIACGIDLPTDGEVRRDNYVHYQCRHFEGFDFEGLTERVWRDGAMRTELPTIRGDIRAGDTAILVRDWQVAEAAAGRPVKITIPGPMTISDTTVDAHYHDPARLAGDLADALNSQVHALVRAGCRHIQIDEPIFARKPDEALDYGIATLARCFEGTPDTLHRAAHMCCGYPNHLDDHDYPKADPTAYLRIAEAVDGTVDAISIEDAHRHNPPDLFERFTRSSLIVGFVRIASSEVETVEAIIARMRQVRDLIPADRLIAAPDCGLGFLGRDLAMVKLRNLCEAARSF